MRRFPALAAFAAAAVLTVSCTRAHDRELGRALLGGEWDHARRLVAAGADINAPQSVRFGEPVLIPLAMRPDPIGVRVALELGADPNRADYIGRTALMFAAMNDRVEAIALLVAAGAEVDAEAVGGRTAVGAAKAADAREALRVLLNAGAKDVEARALVP